MAEQPSDKPGVLAVVHLVVADMPEKAAYGCINDHGEPVVYADRAAVEGDSQARANAYRAITAALAPFLGAA